MWTVMGSAVQCVKMVREGKDAMARRPLGVVVQRYDDYNFRGNMKLYIQREDQVDFQST